MKTQIWYSVSFWIGWPRKKRNSTYLSKNSCSDCCNGHERWTETQAGVMGGVGWPFMAACAGLPAVNWLFIFLLRSSVKTLTVLWNKCYHSTKLSISSQHKETIAALNDPFLLIVFNWPKFEQFGDCLSILFDFFNWYVLILTACRPDSWDPVVTPNFGNVHKLFGL